MFTKKQQKIISQQYNTAMERILKKHIGFFKGHDTELFLISDEYPGVWLEHTYDAIFFAKLEPAYTHIAKNVLQLFLDNQKENGQLPCFIIDRNKCTDMPEYGYSQIQECVSFFRLCFEFYEISNDIEFLNNAYEKGKKWIEWCESCRMVNQNGLIETFCGFDDGHDNSPRKNGMKYKCTAKNDDAAQYPDDDNVLPIISPDVNAVYYGDLLALSEIAKILNKLSESEYYLKKAEVVKKLIIKICYDEKDNFFYDVDRYGKMRKYLSISITNIFTEHVLDSKFMDKIYCKHLKNPKEFFTPYPFPSIAISDPQFQKNLDGNSWGYYSQALTILRCTRWMDYYGKQKDFDEILKKWIAAWTFGNKIMFGQELDPITGETSQCSEWYSSCMLVYIYAVRRLGLNSSV